MRPVFDDDIFCNWKQDGNMNYADYLKKKGQVYKKNNISCSSIPNLLDCTEKTEQLINPYREKIHTHTQDFKYLKVLLSQIFTDPDTSLVITLFPIPLGMPAWHSLMLSTEESQRF